MEEIVDQHFEWTYGGKVHICSASFWVIQQSGKYHFAWVCNGVVWQEDDHYRLKKAFWEKKTTKKDLASYLHYNSLESFYGKYKLELAKGNSLRDRSRSPRR